MLQARWHSCTGVRMCTCHCLILSIPLASFVGPLPRIIKAPLLLLPSVLRSKSIIHRDIKVG